MEGEKESFGPLCQSKKSMHDKKGTAIEWEEGTTGKEQSFEAHREKGKG